MIARKKSINTANYKAKGPDNKLSKSLNAVIA